jgi:hypothetical protein
MFDGKLAFAILLILGGCRTLDESAESVEVVPAVHDEDCRFLGMVSVDFVWWGGGTETSNVLRNQTAELGGDVLLLTGDTVGFAYKCRRSQVYR